MKQIAWMAALLLSPGLLFAAPQAGAQSTSGQWVIHGDVMGTPVGMTCTLTDTSHNLTGVCSGAQDGYIAHKISGKVKGSNLELHFQTAMGGNSMTLIVNGKLNEDQTKMDGTLDIEPMGMGGAFDAVRMQDDPVVLGPSPARTPLPRPSGGAPATAAKPTDPAAAAGTWKVDGDVQGTPVKMTCAISVTELLKLAGTCTAADNTNTPRKLAGALTEKGVEWHFDTDYQGNPITVSMTGQVAADGSKMSGEIGVAPMNVFGTFVAIRQ